MLCYTHCREFLKLCNFFRTTQSDEHCIYWKLGEKTIYYCWDLCVRWGCIWVEWNVSYLHKKSVDYSLVNIEQGICSICFFPRALVLYNIISIFVIHQGWMGCGVSAQKECRLLTGQCRTRYFLQFGFSTHYVLNVVQGEKRTRSLIQRALLAPARNLWDKSLIY